MRQPEMREESSTACGYGLLGLCCSDCLLGPCRLTPFDEDPVKGLCGDDRDRMVARNLLRLAIREASQGIHHLKETVLKVSPQNPASAVIEETKGLLSLFPQSAGTSISSLYPEKVFPSLRGIFGGSGFPPDSLINLLLDSVDLGERESSKVEEILTQSLRISLAVLASDELRMNMTGTGDGGGPNTKDAEISEALESLPSAPCPVIIHLSGDDLPSTSSLNQTADELGQKIDSTAAIISIKEARALPLVGRGMSRKWALPTTGSRALVLISSRHVTSTLGALALGYTVVSFPPLPIHGSVLVEKFFCDDFERRFGNTYLPSWKDELISKIVQLLMQG